MVLSTLKKTKTDGLIYEPVAGVTDAKGQPKMIPVDFEGMLLKLRKKIMEIHVQRIQHGEVESKPTLQLLNVSISCWHL